MIKTLPKLILHFDVNKTVIIGDSAKNLCITRTVMELIASFAWGSVKQDQWVPMHNEISFAQPRKDLLSYKAYLDSKFPKLSKNDQPDDKERTDYNKNIKARKSEIIQDFVKNGHPGEIYQQDFFKIMKKLTLDQELIAKLQERQIKIFEHGNYHIIPSFFKMIEKLIQDNREFAIVFRTFGNDIQDVIFEFNEFCNGTHPVFHEYYGSKVNLNGTNGTKNFIINKSKCGIIYRNYSKNVKDINMSVGNLTRKKDQTQEDKLLKGGESVYHFLIDELTKGNGHSFAIQDDYDSWARNEEKLEYAKPLLVDVEDNSVHQIFFDDNIERHEGSIVDCRNVKTSEVIPFEECWDTYIHQVDTISAVLDEDYFYKQVLICEKNRAARSKI